MNRKKQSKKKTTLTVILTAHNEGLIAHKTMQSIFRALRRIEKEVSAQIIVHIDDGTPETINYFNRYANNPVVEIILNNFGDPAPSRNFAIAQAQAQYIALIDGDDLISENYFEEAMKLISSTHEKIIVHPEAILTFGDNQKNALTIARDSYDPERDAMVFVGENRWGSPIIADRETLLAYPYHRLGHGYGHEDYVFNIETTQNGILHRVAPKTVYFYRRSQDSRLSKAQLDHITIPYMEMFNLVKIKSIASRMQAQEEPPRPKKIKTATYKLYKRIRNNNFLNFFITPPAKLVLSLLRPNNNQEESNDNYVPDYVLDAWVNINSIDSRLYPYKETLKDIEFYTAENLLSIGRAFFDLSKSFTKTPDYIILVPWLVRGGADKVVFQYLRALKEIHPDWHFAVIATIPQRNTWAKNLPDYVDFFNFGNAASGLDLAAQELLLTRLITQLKCYNLHIINSELAYLWAKSHKTLIKAHYTLNVSLFAYEFIPDSQQKAVFSYDDPYLFDIFDVVDSIFTDNQAIIDYTIQHNGYDSKKFQLHYQPVDESSLTPPKESLVEKNKLHILWAGRVTAVKLPQLLAEIGRHLDPDKFIIDVYGEIDPAINQNIFQNIPAIKYHGAFDGFDTLPIKTKDLLLYTSLTDGMPNVILEATNAGLPIIATNDGGVGELIQNGVSGILVESFTDYRPFVAALEDALADPNSLYQYAKNAQKILKSRHTWQHFVETIKKTMPEQNSKQCYNKNTK